MAKTISEETRKKMSESARKRCTSEWREHMSKLRTTPIDIAMLLDLYVKGHTQEEVAEIMNTTRKVVFNAMKKHGIKTRPKIKRNQFGANNANWKNGRTTSADGYIYIKSPGHPRASKCGDYVAEHVLVMEKHLGRYLIYHGPGHPLSEIVHHIDGNKANNKLCNLQLCSFTEHMQTHGRLRISAKEGDARAGF